jgi:hypothetical protein
MLLLKGRTIPRRIISIAIPIVSYFVKSVLFWQSLSNSIVSIKPRQRTSLIIGCLSINFIRRDFR